MLPVEPVIIAKFAANKICAGCSAHGRIEQSTELCASCFGIRMHIYDRERKLHSTIREVSASWLKKIRDSLQYREWVRQGRPKPSVETGIRHQNWNDETIYRMRKMEEKK